MLSESEIKSFLEKRTYWYHKIQLTENIITPGFELDPIWNQIRNVRSGIDYQDKTVLDIASFDGMFAFEAEKEGASKVIATDCLYKSFENFLFCQQHFKSKVFPYFNVSPYNLSERLDVYFQEHYDDIQEDRRFDIIQHFGLLYHLRDPMLSLLQARSVIKPNGKLIIETDYIMENEKSMMVFNGIPNSVRIRDNYSVWWAPTKKCLYEMLEASFFKIDKSKTSEIFFDVPGRIQGKLAEKGLANNLLNENKVGRICVVAEAVDFKESSSQLLNELERTYRNPGLSNTSFVI